MQSKNLGKSSDWTPFFWGGTDLPTSLGSVKWHFWGKRGFSTHSSEKQPCICVSGAKTWPCLVGSSPLLGTYAPVPQTSGGWLDVLSQPPHSASGEAQQHRSFSNNPSSLLAALCWPLAIPAFLWISGTSPWPFTDPEEWWDMLAACKALLHLCFFCESVCNSQEPLRRKLSLDCTWQP